jgi:E3 ubiquitin-protein ligase HUWE1
LDRLPLLRALLKCVLHLLQNAGTADGMRTLTDSSLPKSIKKIFQYSTLFGHVGAFGLAANIMSTFIHNEPTSLVILQESGLTKEFLIASMRNISVSAEVSFC